MDDEDDIFEVRVSPVAVFTLAIVIILALYGAASIGRDLMMLALRITCVL
jgi:hypothetical protein